MLVIFPGAAWMFLCILLARRWNSWRLAFIAASTICATLLVGTTELLSTVYQLNQAMVSLIWFSIMLITGGCHLLRSGRCPAIRLRQGAWWCPIAGITMIIVILGLLSVISPPNDWDSMTYHMSRVAHWIQNGSVAHYRTSMLRQLVLNPGAEYIILNLQLLTDGDRLANLVQWFSMLGSVVGVTLIAQHLGSTPKGQIMAAAFCVSLPMGILQSTSTQNDYVCAFWLVSSTVWGLKLLDEVRHTRVLMRRCLRWAILLGLALGLAMLTKATAYLFALPFWVMLVLLTLRQAKWRAAVLLAVAVALATLMNVGFWGRNVTGFGTPLVTEGANMPGYQYSNEAFAPKYILSNVIRNIALELGTPSRTLNRFTYRIVNSLHRRLGWDINDHIDTWPGTSFGLDSRQYHEDFAGNPLHLLILTFLLFAVGLTQTCDRRRFLMTYATLVLVGFILFCGYLKWQPYHCRLLLPLFVLASPFVGGALSRRTPDYLLLSLATVLLIASTPWILNDSSRPIMGPKSFLLSSRTENYFRNRPFLYQPYMQACRFLISRKTSHIGLLIGEDSYEYPFWVLLNSGSERPVWIENLGNSSLNKAIMRQKFVTPEAIITVGNDASIIRLGDQVYERQFVSENLAVFLPPKNSD